MPRVVDEGAGAEQGGDGHRVRGGDGTVEELLGSDDERLGVAAGGEEPAGLGVPEEVDQLAHGADRPLAPERRARPFGQPDGGLGEPRVVRRHGQMARPARPANSA